MKKKSLFGIIFASSLFASAAAQAMPAQVLLIRHAEKPEAGDELSSMGWERARLLPTLFQRPEYKKFGDPVALIGMAPKDAKGSIRSIQTLKYVSDTFHVAVNTSFNDEAAEAMIKHVKETAAYDGKFVVICWNHNSVKKIVKGFGLKKPPKMKGEEYDRAYLITFENGSGTLQDLPQRLLPTDPAQ